ncbi:hypothetical protein HNP37_000001 [Flavobacterium nitrogenifigens]|uniref:Cyanobacterial TRADD-N associated 2 transmembrane domain-containing protein n=2 Tax=Flavobacterium TaxID=237 RepID=A0A7W7ITI8_9FLAO|nr:MULTISPECIES: hypothetical protein [Flavobacterium]MBB4799962.1 hypothetical protein [Flavobacterium nitrogenifigens]MBB6386288.1 hypothetical protein [Flavobacterium notoginsengisoli]
MNSFSELKDFFAIIIPVFVAIISSIVLLKAKQVQFGKLSIDLDKDDQKAQDTAEYSSSDNGSDISLTTNERQFLLLKQYHAQGLGQSRISFWFSLIFATCGFAVIAISILNVDNNKSFLTQPSSIISLISGTIIDAVSALFFVQSNKSRELMSTFFEKLRADRKIEESLKLADSITDENLRSKLKMILSLHFAEIVTSDNIVSIVFKDLDKSITVETEKK